MTPSSLSLSVQSSASSFSAAVATMSGMVSQAGVMHVLLGLQHICCVSPALMQVCMWSHIVTMSTYLFYSWGLCW